MEMISKVAEKPKLSDGTPLTDCDSDEEQEIITHARKRLSTRLLIRDDSDEENVEAISSDVVHKSSPKNAGGELDKKDSEEFDIDDDKENVNKVNALGKPKRGRILKWSNTSDEDEEPQEYDEKSKQLGRVEKSNYKYMQPFQDDTSILKVTNDIGQSDEPSSALHNPDRLIFANKDLFDSEGSASDEDSAAHRKTFDKELSSFGSDDEGVSLAELKKAAVKAAKGDKKGAVPTVVSQKMRQPKKQDLKELHSESQRLVRESRVRLPYHVPQQRTLDEFLNRRKSAPAVLKPNAKEVENILKKSINLIKKNQENGGKSQMNSAKRKLTMDVPYANESPKHQMTVDDGLIYDVQLPPMGMCQSEAEDPKVEESSNSDVHETNLERTCPENIAGTSSCSLTVAENEVLPGVISLCKATPLSDIMKDSISNDDKILNLELSNEESVEGAVLDLVPSSDVAKDSFTGPKIHTPADGPKADLSSHFLSSANSRLPVQILNAARNFTPKLCGQPNTVICLDDPNQESFAPPTGVLGLIKRFIQHTTPRQPPIQSQQIKLSILKKENDSSGEQSLTTENIMVNASVAIGTDGNATPGVALSILKETLKAELTRKRAEMRQKRLLLQAEEDDAESDLSNDSAEEEILSDVTDSEEEVIDDCDADEEDDDADVEWARTRTKSKHRSVFLDDEALEEDNDDGLEEEEDEDTLEEDSVDLEKEAKNKNGQAAAEEIVVTEQSQVKIIKSKMENDPKDALILRLESEEMNATQPVTSNVGNSDVPMLSRCATLELFPSPVFDDRMANEQERPSLSKNQSLDTSFELIGSNIAAYQPGGGGVYQQETPNSSGLSMKRKFSHLSFPIEDSQELFQETPRKDNDLEYDDLALSPLEGFETQADTRSTGTYSIRRKLGFVDSAEVSSQDNMNQLLSLCSGNWTEPSERQSTIVDEALESQLLTNTQEIEDTVLELKAAKVRSMLKDGMMTYSASVRHHDGNSVLSRPDQLPHEEHIFKSENLLHSEDELSISSLRSDDELLLKHRRQVKRLISDSESDKEDNCGSAFGDSDDDDNDNTHVTKGFFEEEAELSGSDVPSDEDEEVAVEDDVMEEELGDLDEYSEDEVKNQVEKVHMKMMLDEDQRQLRLYKEMYLEDGDLHTDGQGRIKKFRWRNIDDNSNDTDAIVKFSDSEDEVYDNENVELRLLRHEREKWLHDHKVVENDDLNFLMDSNTSTSGKRKMHVLSRNNSLVIKSTAEDKTLDFNHSKKTPVNYCGSFLARSKDLLSKIAEMTKGTVDGASNGPRNSRNFVFATVSPSKEEPVEPPLKIRRGLSMPFPCASVHPSLSKRLSLSDGNSRDSSIFDLL